MHSQEGKRGPNEAENQLAKYTLSNHTHQHKAAKHTQSRRLVTLDTSFGLRPLANKVNYLYRCDALPVHLNIIAVQEHTYSVICLPQSHTGNSLLSRSVS